MVTPIPAMFWTHELLLDCYLANVNIILAEFNAKNVVQDFNRRNGTKIQMLNLSSVKLATASVIPTNACTLRKWI